MAGILEEILSLPTPKQFTNSLGVKNPAENPAADDGYNQARKSGYTEDQIQAAKTGPAPGQSALEFYTKTFQKPDPVNEKQVRNAKLYAGIGDALGLLGQMLSAHKGAHIRNRDYNQSAMAKNEAEERDIRALYRKSLDDYNKGAYSAMLHDLQRADHYNQNIYNIQAREAAAEKQRKWNEERDAKKETARIAAADLKWNRDNDPNSFQNKYKTANLENQKKRTGIAGVNAATSRMRLNNQINKGNNSIIFQGNPEDPNAETNQYGEIVSTYPITKEEKDRLYRMAIGDPIFIQNNLNFFVEGKETNTVTGVTIPTGKFSPRKGKEMYEAIVGAYAQEKYNEIDFSKQNNTPATKNQGGSSQKSNNKKKKAFSK